MSATVLLCVALFTAIYSLLALHVLVHELGHAVVALLLTKGPVTAEVGIGPVAWRVHIGRLEVALHTNVGLWRIVSLTQGILRGASRSEAIQSGSPWRVLLITLGGPAASLLYILLVTGLIKPFAGLRNDYIWVLPTVILAGVAAILWLSLVTSVIPRRQIRRVMPPGAQGNDAWFVYQSLRLIWQARRGRHL